MILSFAVKVLLQAHIFATFSGILRHIDRGMHAAEFFYSRIAMSADVSAGRTRRGASGRKYAPLRLISDDAPPCASCVRWDAWPTRRGAFGRADGSCASRVSASRASASTLQPCVLQFWPWLFSLSLVSGCQRFFSARSESTIDEPVMVKANRKPWVKVAFPSAHRQWRDRPVRPRTRNAR
jgi:hypothetical protein